MQRRKDGLQGEKREEKGVNDYMAREAGGFSYFQTSLEITPYLNLEGSVIHIKWYLFVSPLKGS